MSGFDSLIGEETAHFKVIAKLGEEPTGREINLILNWSSADPS